MRRGGGGVLRPVRRAGSSTVYLFVYSKYIIDPYQLLRPASKSVHLTVRHDTHTVIHSPSTSTLEERPSPTPPFHGQSTAARECRFEPQYKSADWQRLLRSAEFDELQVCIHTYMYQSTYVPCISLYRRRAGRPREGRWPAADGSRLHAISFELADGSESSVQRQSNASLTERTVLRFVCFYFLFSFFSAICLTSDLASAAPHRTLSPTRSPTPAWYRPCNNEPMDGTNNG